MAFSRFRLPTKHQGQMMSLTIVTLMFALAAALAMTPAILGRVLKEVARDGPAGFGHSQGKKRKIHYKYGKSMLRRWG